MTYQATGSVIEVSGVYKALLNPERPEQYIQFFSPSAASEIY